MSYIDGVVTPVDKFCWRAADTCCSQICVAIFMLVSPSHK